MPESATIDTKAGLMRWNLDMASGQAAHQRPPSDIRRLIRSSQDLPPLPEISRRLLRIQNDPNASAVMLADIVELDPLLSAQMLRWANSAYYGLREPITSVRDAIMRSLGFDLALNLALAVAALSPLQTPNEGPIARDAVWRHGVKCGELMRELSKKLPSGARAAPGPIHFVGLTQNIGYLLLGHLLPRQFRFLSRLIQANPTLTLPEMDRLALGVDHTQLGLWLFDAWDMPPALRTVVRHHHNPSYQGDHEDLVLLTCLADSLLSDTPWSLGARLNAMDRLMVIGRLGISLEACGEALATVMDNEAR
jgi:HD-like signal output (HDOD) protein